jgi:PadR family transcriptional regulator PadR
MADDDLVSQMRRGALEYCVLALLAEERQYGYGLVRSLAEVDGMLTTEGTLYAILARLSRDGLVEARWEESPSGPPRKYYRLTSRGWASLRNFQSEWSTFRSAVDAIMARGVRRA